MERLLAKIFKFLASVKLAVVLLVIFGIMLSVSTVLESKYSTEYAQRVVYKTMWFDLFLFFLGMNVLCSALSRMPWKKRHTGFVITHLGIIIILVGSMITRKLGVEGQIMLQEGESTQVMRLNEDVFSVAVPRISTQKAFNPWFMNHDIPEGREVKYQIPHTNITCYITDYLFNPQTSVQVVNGGSQNNPAVQIALHRPGHNHNELEEWLFANDSRTNTLELSLASIHFRRFRSEDEWLSYMQRTPAPGSGGVENPEKPHGLLKIKKGGRVVHEVKVQAMLNQPYTFSYNGESYALRFEEYLSHAYVRNDQLVNVKDNPINPTVRFLLSGPFGKEEHLAFAQFPEFGSLHGQNEATSGFQVEYLFPMNQSQTPKENRLDILLAPDGTLHYRATNKGGGWQTGQLAQGESVPTTWNDLQLKLLKFYPNARQTQEIYDAGRDAPGRHNSPALAYRLEHNGDTRTGYLQYNGRTSVNVGGEQVILDFGQRRYPVGFELELVDFRAPVYPGTTRPQRFESDVLVRAAEIDGGEKKTKIHMNHPLYQGKFTVFQSSYIKGQGGQPDISIFSVAYAPGTMTIYAGSIVMCVGMLLMFFTRQFSSINYRRYKVRAKHYSASA